MHALAFLSLVLSAHATDPKLEVTSFYFTNPAPNRTAEICGRIQGEFNGQCRITVTVDPGHNAASYVAWPDREGHWCALVNSHTGRAQVALWHGDNAAAETGVIRAEAHL